MTAEIKRGRRSIAERLAVREDEEERAYRDWLRARAVPQLMAPGPGERS